MKIVFLQFIQYSYLIWNLDKTTADIFVYFALKTVELLANI